jgi:hypothetical protein
MTMNPEIGVNEEVLRGEREKLASKKANLENTWAGIEQAWGEQV